MLPHARKGRLLLLQSVLSRLGLHSRFGFFSYVRIDLLLDTAQVFENFDKHVFLFFDVCFVGVPDELHVDFPVAFFVVLKGFFFVKMVKVFIGNF